MRDQSAPSDESSENDEYSFNIDGAADIIRKLGSIGEVEHVRNLIHNISYSDDLTRDVIKTLRSKSAKGVDIHVSNDINKSLQRALTSARSLSDCLRRVRKIIKSIDEQRDLSYIGNLADALSSALHHESDIDQIVAYTLGKLLVLHNDHNLHYNQNHFRDFGRLASLVGEIKLALTEAYNQSRKLESLYQELQQEDEVVATEPIEIPSWVAISPSVRRLVDITVFLLPKEHQARYAEELRAEIWDLIAAKSTRFMQMQYALLQLSRSWRLRRELRSGSNPPTQAFRCAARWVLASDLRTWPALIAVLSWGSIDTYHDTGPGAAILVVVSGGAAFHAAIKSSRRRLRVEVQRRWKRTK